MPMCVWRVQRDYTLLTSLTLRTWQMGSSASSGDCVLSIHVERDTQTLFESSSSAAAAAMMSPLQGEGLPKLMPKMSVMCCCYPFSTNELLSSSLHLSFWLPRCLEPNHGLQTDVLARWPAHLHFFLLIDCIMSATLVWFLIQVSSCHA